MSGFNKKGSEMYWQGLDVPLVGLMQPEQGCKIERFAVKLQIEWTVSRLGPTSGILNGR